MPNWLPNNPPFLQPAGRLIWATIVTIIMIGPIITAATGKPAFLAKRMPWLRYKSPDGPTWAGAMFGAVYVFAVFLLMYAVIPHEFITFADGYLQWGRDKYVIKSTTNIPGLGEANWPFSIDMQAVRDVVVVGIYGIFFLGNIVMWVLWQKRPTLPEGDEEPTELVDKGTSSFGRPLKAEA